MVLQDFYLSFSWEPQYENMRVLHVLVLMLELSDFWLWRLGCFSHWDQIRNALQKVAVDSALKNAEENKNSAWSGFACTSQE